MARPSNREIEQYYFAQFSAHFPLPSGEIEHCDKPDVVIRGERRVGIEITNLYLADGANSSSEQVQRKRREAVVREAQKLHFASGGRKIELTVAFDPLHPIDNVNAVASALARFAQTIQHHPANGIPRSYFEHIAQLQFVYHNPREYPDSQWRVSQVFTVPSLSVGRLREIITKKERRLTQYKPCDAYWLLVVVDFIDAAQDQEITWPADCPAMKTSYERVIIYKPQFAQWTEFPVQKL